MNQEKYFVVTSGEDGISVDSMSKEELEKRLREKYYTGDIGPDPTFLDKVPDIDKGYFFWSRSDEEPENPILIIKGNILVPKAVQRVTEYEVE